MDNKILSSFDKKLRKEALLKSSIWAIIVGGLAAFLAAGIMWILLRDGLILSITVFLVVTAGFMPLFYYLKFRPTVKSTAKRVDRLGLEERMITMLELNNEDSYIARVQREDAIRMAQRRNPMQLKMKFAAVSFVLLIAAVVLAACMTTFSYLSANNKTAFSPNRTGAGNFYDVSYEADEGGFIEGNLLQQIEHGGSGETVMAVAMEGYEFVGWSDGELETGAAAERKETSVIKDIHVTAYFVLVENTDGDETGIGEEIDEPGGRPSPINVTNNGQPPPPPPVSGPAGTGASGADRKDNMVMDGDTYYRLWYQTYLDRAIELLESDQEIPQELRDIIETFYGIII